MLIKTKRLIIDRFETSDITAWAAIESAPQVRRCVNNKVLTYDQAASYISEHIESYAAKGFGR